MTLGPLDRAASTTSEAALQLRDSRRRRERAAAEVPTSPDPVPGPSGIHGLAASSTASEDSSDGMEGTTGSLTARKRTEESDFTASDENLDRNQDDLTFTALAADRYGVSNRAVAGVINAFQMDIGRLSSDDKSKIVDPKKVWRARQAVRQESAKQRWRLQQKRVLLFRACTLMAEKTRRAQHTRHPQRPRSM